MGFIQANFDSVPDEIAPVKPGVYACVVKEANMEPTKDGSGEKLVVRLAVDEPNSTENGRQLFTHIGLSGNGLTLVKALCRSAGIKPGADGLDTEELLGKSVRVRVKAGVYKDPDTGETRETTRVAEFLP